MTSEVRVDGDAQRSPIGGKRTCVRLVSTSAAGNEASGKRFASSGVTASATAPSAVGSAAIAHLVGPLSARSCEECGLPMEQGRPLLFGMEGDWVCEPCEAAQCAALVWGDG